jgi:hypothetical protein
MRELTAAQADDLYELVSERAIASRPPILTSNRAPADWYALFPNPVVAESLLDRLINTSHQVLMDGPSYRPRKRPRPAGRDHPSSRTRRPDRAATRPAGDIMTGPHRQRPVDTPRPCHYADDPARRPRCTLTATIQIGAVALCASCNAARSTLGKGQTPVPLPPGPAFDVLGWVATAHQQARAAEATLTAAVTRARQTGASWTVIGAQLGLSRQGAQQRFTRIRT